MTYTSKLVRKVLFFSVMIYQSTVTRDSSALCCESRLYTVKNMFYFRLVVLRIFAAKVIDILS